MYAGAGGSRHPLRGEPGPHDGYPGPPGEWVIGGEMEGTGKGDAER